MKLQKRPLYRVPRKIKKELKKAPYLVGKTKKEVTFIFSGALKLLSKL